LVKARRGIGGHEGVDSVDVSVPVLVTSRGTITIVIALIVVIAEVVAVVIVIIVTIAVDGVTITSCLVRFEVIYLLYCITSAPSVIVIAITQSLLPTSCSIELI